MDDNLIYDLGMNDGEDTAFYLHKGHRVIAIEANPLLCDKARQRFSDEIRSGKLTLLNLAVSDAKEQRDFYINLDNDHWSSLDPVWGTRDGTRFEVIKIQSVPFRTIIEQYGTPHYLKVDVEGADLAVLDQLQKVSEKPQFISVEEHGVEYFALMWALGYRGFKIVEQRRLPNLAYPDWQFKFGSSGPFGNEAPGPWLPFGDATLEYMLNVRDCRGRFLLSGNWFDIHGTLDVPSLRSNHPYPKIRRKRSIRAIALSTMGKLKRKISRRPKR